MTDGRWARDIAGAARERWLLGPTPFGRLGIDNTRPPNQEPAMVPGGRNAPELFMKPVDVGPETILSGWLQLKVDGIGAGKIENRIVTPQGSVFDAALHCLPGLTRLEQALGAPHVIVGEYAEEAGYDATMAAFKRGMGTGVFYIYDAVPFDQWVVDRCTQPIEERLDRLQELAPMAESPFVGFLLPRPVDEPYQALSMTRELWAAGAEGTVVKKRRSRYQRRRSDDWVRLKEVVTIDVIVTEVIHSGGRIRSLVCKDPASPMPPINVGSGWNSDAEAQLLAMDCLAPEDRWIEISYNRKAGSTRPRHARFNRVRLKKGA